MIYQIGAWKKSTLWTLERLKKENKEGNKPYAAFFRNGSVSEWLKLLRESGYVDYDDGYKINKRGILLLKELRGNPTSISKKKKIRETEKGVNKSVGNEVTLIIEGKNFRTEAKIDAIKLAEVVKIINS